MLAFEIEMARGRVIDLPSIKADNLAPFAIKRNRNTA